MHILAPLFAFTLAACAVPSAVAPAGNLLDPTPLAWNGARLQVLGLSCPNCATNVDLELLQVAGVEHVQVDLGTGFVDVGFATAGPRPSARDLTEAVHGSGFTLVAIAER